MSLDALRAVATLTANAKVEMALQYEQLEGVEGGRGKGGRGKERPRERR
jgi:hypothetical protein